MDHVPSRVIVGEDVVSLGTPEGSQESSRESSAATTLDLPTKTPTPGNCLASQISEVYN